MLNIMRRSKGAMRIVLGFVVVGVAGSFAAALYGIWGGALSERQQGAPSWIAIVDGEQISPRLFHQRRGVLYQDFRERFKDQGIDDDTLASIVDQQALGSLLGLRLAKQAADREGLRVMPTEIADTIVGIPTFQRNGRFVGSKLYRDLLRAQGLDTVEFETELGQELAADKLRLAVFSLARVDDREVEKRYRDEVERVDLDYILLADSTYEDARTASESDLRAYFAGHSSSYVTPEARRASYVLFDREARAATVQVSDAEIGEYYEKNKATLYTHPEQRRASHILLRLPPDATPDKDSDLRAKASAALARVRAGEDFGEVAKQISEDPGSASSGGDLGFFSRGRMVREFEDAVFSLAVGTVSDVVKSPFGYHIIKVTETRDAGVQPLAEVRDEIRRTLGVQKAQVEIRDAAEKFLSRLASQEASFDRVASEEGLPVADTGFFAKGEPAGALGRLPQVDESVFSLAQGARSAPVSVPQGLAIFVLQEVRAPQPAPFESVRARVETDLKKSRAREKARAVSSEILSASGDLSARAEKRKLEVKNYAQVNRSQPLPPLTDASKAAAFTAPPGSVLGPYESEDGLVILEVKAKSPSTAEDSSAQRDALRKRMIEEDRAMLYQALLGRLQKASKIEVNEGLLRTGRGAGG